VENAPSLGWFYDLWKEGNIVGTKTEQYFLSFSYKWLGEKQVHAYSLPDFRGYKPGSEDDKQLIKELWRLFDEADILVAHNGDRFDIRKSNARFAYYNLPPPSPYRTVDTLKIAKKYFNFTSNKLDELGNFLGYGRKLVHTGFHLWKGCMTGDPEAWRVMVRYNKRDVVLLEQIYLHFLPWITNHPPLSADCPNCGKATILTTRSYMTKRGPMTRGQCECGAWRAITKKGEYAR
jgi:hypothetical protein